MSSKKIIRLNSPSKQKELGRTPQSTFANTRFMDLQSIIEVQNVECSETLQLTLINQINRIYKETQGQAWPNARIKKQLQRQRQTNQELNKQKKRLKAQVRILERQFQTYKEMYELQRNNHQKLREFYQKRQKQWQLIVYSHKQMLEEYDNQNGALMSRIQNEQQEDEGEIGVQSKQMGGNDERLQNNTEPKPIKTENQKKQIRKLKRRKTLDKATNRQEQSSPKIAYYYAEISRLYSQQKQFARRSMLDDENEQAHVQRAQLNRNPEADDLFERILRKTYYYFRERSLSLNQIKQCEDMIKLKHAKTSTKQRLLKTIRKQKKHLQRLEFQVENQNELQAFCQYIQNFVLHHQKMIRGDLVFNFIIDKLTQCQKLAQSSNSVIERLEVSALKSTNENYDIQKVSRQNLELLLNSTIKKPPMAVLASQISDKVRYSISSLQNLSDLIHGEMGS